jgi:hypothetical protein
MEVKYLSLISGAYAVRGRIADERSFNFFELTSLLSPILIELFSRPNVTRRFPARNGVLLPKVLVAAAA